MLFDSFEEEFDLPAAAIAVEFGNDERRQGETVGQKGQPLIGFGILETEASQRGFQTLARVEAGENDRLITDQSPGTIDEMCVATLGLEIRLAAGDEETTDLVEAIQEFEVEEVLDP